MTKVASQSSGGQTVLPVNCDGSITSGGHPYGEKQTTTRCHDALFFCVFMMMRVMIITLPLYFLQLLLFSRCFLISLSQQPCQAVRGDIIHPFIDDFFFFKHRLEGTSD